MDPDIGSGFNESGSTALPGDLKRLEHRLPVLAAAYTRERPEDCGGNVQWQDEDDKEGEGPGHQHTEGHQYRLTVDVTISEI
jgi:hypothetical protein